MESGEMRALLSYKKSRTLAEKAAERLKKAATSLKLSQEAWSERTGGDPAGLERQAKKELREALEVARQAERNRPLLRRWRKRPRKL